MKQSYFTQKCKMVGSLSLFFFMFLAFQVHAQTKTITGTVTSEDGSPVPGVNVVQKGTTNGTATDFDGKYTLDLQGGLDILEFSYIGFATQDIKVGNLRSINVTMTEDTQSLDEVVIIGYAPVDREKVLGAMSTVDSKEIVQVTPTNSFEAVQGRLSGVQILSNGGPGAGFDIRIRGIATFSSGTSPLYVVDGQQLTNIDNLDPSDIKTFEVLKDGATAAIYGSRGANGVVLITTKSGSAGGVKIDVTANTAYTTLNGSLPLSNTRQRVLYEDIQRSNQTALTANQRDSLSLLLRNSFDLQKLITRPAVRQQVNIGVSGGDEKTKVYWNTGYLDQEGVVVNSSYKRLNSRFKMDFKASKKFTLGTNLNLSFEEQYGLNENQVFQQMVERIAYFPVFEPDGSYSPEIAGRQNPLAEAQLRTQRSRNYRANLFNYAEYKILPSLSFKSTLGINFRYRKDNDFEPILTQNPNNPIPKGAEENQLSYDIQQENFFNYIQKFGDHSVSAFAGMQLQKYWFEGLGIGANFLTDNIETFNNVDPLTLAINTGQTENENHTLFSLFAGFNYDYKNKYLVGATIRRDGSSRFGEENKYGVFPSVTLGWRVSGENFMADSNVINNLLFRYSYGQTGNENIGNYEFTSTYAPGAIYNGVSGIFPATLGNSAISWENTISNNIGMDLGMFNNRFNLSVDVWSRLTEDLLATVPLAEESGYSGIRQNIGSVENRGIDIALSGTILQSDNFTWSSSFNISFLENEVKELAGGTSFQSGNYLIEEGQPIGNIYGYKNLGIYQYDESNAYSEQGVRLTPNFDSDGAFVNYTLNGQEYTGTVNQMRNAGQVLRGGDIIWDDVSGDYDITVDDRQIIGNGLPKYFGGFSNDFTYKNFSFGFLLDYTFGNDLYRNYDEARNDLNSANETPGPDRIEGAWRNPGDITEFPRLARVAQNRERPNSFYVTPGDYIRLRYVRFEYRLAPDYLNRIDWINAVSFNLSFNNWYTWTNYVGYNPELGSRGNALQPGIDNLRYPNTRDIILGLRVQF